MCLTVTQPSQTGIIYLFADTVVKASNGVDLTVGSETQRGSNRRVNPKSCVRQSFYGNILLKLAQSLINPRALIWCLRDPHITNNRESEIFRMVYKIGLRYRQEGIRFELTTAKSCCRWWVYYCPRMAVLAPINFERNGVLIHPQYCKLICQLLACFISLRGQCELRVR